MDLKFMENTVKKGNMIPTFDSIWAVFKKLYDKGYVYRG